VAAQQVVAAHMQAVAAAAADSGGSSGGAPGGGQGLGQGFDVGQQQGLNQGLGQAFDGRGALGGMFSAGQQGGGLGGPPPQAVAPPPSPPGPGPGYSGSGGFDGVNGGFDGAYGARGRTVKFSNGPVGKSGDLTDYVPVSTLHYLTVLNGRVVSTSKHAK